jgi:hypothetical protein
MNDSIECWFRLRFRLPVWWFRDLRVYQTRDGSYLSGMERVDSSLHAQQGQDVVPETNVVTGLARITAPKGERALSLGVYMGRLPQRGGDSTARSENILLELRVGEGVLHDRILRGK